MSIDNNISSPIIKGQNGTNYVILSCCPLLNQRWIPSKVVMPIVFLIGLIGLGVYPRTHICGAASHHGHLPAMATQIAGTSGTPAMLSQFNPSAHGPAVWNNLSDTCNAGRTHFQATYVRADLYQQSSCRPYDLGLESVPLDLSQEGCLE